MRIWDIDELAVKAVYDKLHSDKVQSVRWNRVNEQVLLSGGYDGYLKVQDIRQQTEALSFKLDKSVCQDIESTNWHYKSEHHFICGTESGIMYGFDTRKPGSPVFEVKAHKKACTSVDFSPHIPSMVASVGVDKICRIWDINQLAAGEGKSACVA